MTRFVDLLEPAPRPWGLRGDPVLFDAMKQVVDDLPLPATEAALRDAFENTFEVLTGTPLADAPDLLRVAATRRENGGMSNGIVSPGYWRDKMLPALIKRFHAANAP
ncbi:MAG: hypothetical protein ACSHWS_12225 [Sulfitobacter sp.]